MAGLELPGAAVARGGGANRFLTVEDLYLAVGFRGPLQDEAVKGRRAADRRTALRVSRHCRRVRLVGVDGDGESPRRGAGVAGRISVGRGQTMAAVAQLRRGEAPLPFAVRRRGPDLFRAV